MDYQKKLNFAQVCDEQSRPRSVVEFKSLSNSKLGLHIDQSSKECDACKYNETKSKINWKTEKINY